MSLPVSTTARVGKRKGGHVGARQLAVGLGLLLSVAVLTSAESDWHELILPTSPVPRTGQCMVTLSDGRVVMFGGRAPVEGDLLNDLVTFDDNNWIPGVDDDWIGGVSTTPPSPRTGHTMDLMLDGDVLLFGGEDESGEVLNDLYALTDQGWRLIAARGALPSPRVDHCAWSVNGKLYIAGGRGQGGQPLSDIWEYDPGTNGWQRGIDSPSDYDLWGATAVAYQSRAYLLGPNQGVPFFDMGVDDTFNTADDWWGIVHSDPEPPPKRHAAVTQQGSIAWMVGGYKEGYGVTPCTFSFDLATLVWRYLGPMPVPTQGAAAAMYYEAVLLFGGLMGDGTISGKTYLYRPPQ